MMEDNDRLDDEPSLPWQSILEGVLRQRRVVLAVFGVGALLSALLATLQQPTYSAAAKLMVTSERARIMVSPDPKEGSRVEPVTEQDLNSEVALLRSPALIREVLEPLSAAAPPAAAKGPLAVLSDVLDWPAQLYRGLHEVEAPDPIEQRVMSTAADTEVSVIRGSNLIQVQYTSGSPRWAADFLNRLVDRHVARHAELHQQGVAQQFLGSQRELLSGRLEQAEVALETFYKREGVDSVPEQSTVARRRLAELQVALADADREIAEATARAEYLAKAVPSHPKGPVADGSGTQSPQQVVQTRILELELERSKLLAQYAPNSLKVADIDRQLADARRLAAADARSGGAVNPAYLSLSTDLTQTRAQVAALQARGDALRTQIESHRTTLNHLDRIASEHERLQQEVTSAKENFLTYLKKEEEARFSTALDESRIVNVSIVERASVPTIPERSSAGIKLLVGALASLLLGIVFGYVRDRFDPSVKTAAEAQRVAGLPVLADIAS